MKFSTLSKILAIVAVLAMMFSLAACQGTLALESFTVDRSTIKTSYEIGEEIDFSGIKATAKYSDASLNKVYTYGELTITYDENITATEGTKYVTVSFNDPHLNVKQETQVKIQVATGGADSNLLVLAGFETPVFITNFNDANATGNKLEYGSAGFLGEFVKGGRKYVIGNENEFKFMPVVSVLDGRVVTELDRFYASVEISINRDGTYAALSTVDGENNIIEYFDGETLIATVNTYEGIYNFSAAAVGTEVKISVLPSAEYYIYDSEDFAAVELEAKIVKAYNVYEAWQLAVIDDVNDAWNNIESENGILGVTVSGIVLHNDIAITVDDVPASYFYTTETDIIYNKNTNGVLEEKVIPAGTKYLIDSTNVYHRANPSDFLIEGNYFSINLSGFPVVPSPGVFGSNSGRDYGADFSNATLFKFDSSRGSSDAEKANNYGGTPANVTINNISLIGNASRDNWVDSTESLASAGGLIMIKSSWYTKTTMDNVIGHSFFISYFSDAFATLTAKNVKCYDSYQNAGMVWGAATLIFEDSFLNGSGGPIVIATSEYADDRNPTLTLTNTIAETHLSGSELWFTATGANTFISQITAIGSLLEVNGFGNFVDAKGNMNIMGLLMANAYKADDIVTGVDAKGYMFFDNNGINRDLSDPVWQAIYATTKGAMASGQIPPFLTVNGADGNIIGAIMYAGEYNLVDVFTQTTFTPGSAPAELTAIFQAAKSITLTQGGMSITFAFYH